MLVFQKEFEKLYNKKFEHFQPITLMAIELILNEMILINSMAQVLLLGKMERSYIFMVVVILEFLQIMLLKPAMSLRIPI